MGVFSSLYQRSLSCCRHTKRKRNKLFYRNKDGVPQSWDLEKKTTVNATDAKIKPALLGNYKTKDGTPVKTVFTLMTERYLDDEYSPEMASKICGVPEEQIERIARELAHVAFKETIEVETEWTDWTGRKHDKFIGRPVSMHAMRGISAHSNGFQACRDLFIFYKSYLVLLIVQAGIWLNPHTQNM